MRDNLVQFSEKYQSNIHTPTGRLIKEATNSASSLLNKRGSEQFMDELSPQNRIDVYEAMRKMNELISRAQNDPASRQAILHTVAMTAGESYGPNLNGDYFTRSSLLNSYPSFVNNGHVYLEHRHNDLVYGRPLVSIYNDAMDRIELIAQIDCSQLPNIYEKMRDPDAPIFVSMSVNVPWDRCSICGNERNARLGVPACDHVQRGKLNTFLPGTQDRIYVTNPEELPFFDISLVEQPADPAARSLAKVASDKFFIQVPNMYTVPAHAVQSPEIYNFKAVTKKAADARRELTKTANLLHEQDSLETVQESEVLPKFANELVQNNISFKQYMMYKVAHNLAFSKGDIETYCKYKKTAAGLEAAPEQINNVLKFFASTPLAAEKVQNKLDTVIDHVSDDIKEKRKEEKAPSTLPKTAAYQKYFAEEIPSTPELQEKAIHYITKVAYGRMAKDIREELSRELGRDIQTENYRKAMSTIAYLVNQNRLDLIPREYTDDPIVIELVQKAVLNKQYGTETR